VSPKGEIAISLKSTLYRDQEAVLISIKDNGAGISEEELAHIFDPFFTTRSQGTGLGLSIAYNIIEMHQGTIAIESAPGQGTLVKIFIPSGRNREIE
ncbi:MAG: ATP-binding protein, partial [Atribacterota bacterium]|nr:ATP-binding protein [Atribacterota bacterium]